MRNDEDLLEDRFIAQTKDTASKALVGAEKLAIKAEKKVDKQLKEFEKGSSKKDKSNKV